MLSLYEVRDSNSPAKFFQSSGEKTQGKRTDIFDIGFLLMLSATGGLEVLTQNKLDLDDVKKKCCFMHQYFEKEKQMEECVLKLSDILSPDRFSGNFIDFLC